MWEEGVTLRKEIQEITQPLEVGSEKIKVAKARLILEGFHPHMENPKGTPLECE